MGRNGAAGKRSCRVGRLCGSKAVLNPIVQVKGSAELHVSTFDRSQTASATKAAIDYVAMQLNSTLRFCLFALAALPLSGATIKPESVGLSEERLSRIHDTMQRHIDSHDISGAVTLVARKGQIAWL